MAGVVAAVFLVAMVADEALLACCLAACSIAAWQVLSTVTRLSVGWVLWIVLGTLLSTVSAAAVGITLELGCWREPGEDVDVGPRGVAATRCKLSTVAEAATKVSGSLVFLEDWRTPMRGVAVAAVASAPVGEPLVVVEQLVDASPGPTSVGAGRVAAAVPATPSVAAACLSSALAGDGFAVAVVPVSTALS